MEFNRMISLNILGALLLFLNGCTSVSTPPIKDKEGNIMPESIALLEKVKLGGMDQRGAGVANYE